MCLSVLSLLPEKYKQTHKNQHLLNFQLFLLLQYDMIIPLCPLPSLAANVCLHFSLYFSYHKPPSWKRALHKKILQQSILRLPQSVIQYGCHSWDLIKVNACGE